MESLPRTTPINDRDASAAINSKRKAGEDQNSFGVAGAERTVGPADLVSIEKSRKPRPSGPGSSLIFNLRFDNFVSKRSNGPLNIHNGYFLSIKVKFYFA